ncbi:MAG: ABC transporter permease [Gammaproteobacteria bacterium]|nr:ABC transporter permease [Gammaproteobacteria bacterium]
MNSNIIEIDLYGLAIAFLPVLPVLFILYRWNMGTGHALYSLTRMLGQLLIVGYFLAYIFNSTSLLLISMILMIMLFSSSWIALGTVSSYRKKLITNAFIAITAGGGSVLFIVIYGVIKPSPYYNPQYVIPLAGMIFANAMNAVSLAAERIVSELKRGETFIASRVTALQAAMIPVTNSLLAVGLVSLPGMMTGQILSGVSPLIAARYQIVVMCMIYASAGLSAALFLWRSRPQLENILVEKPIPPR